MDDKKELLEAIEAGRDALSSLKTAQNQLQLARNWGIVDIFGGGFFTNMMKYPKIDSASNAIEDAKQKLFIFQGELKDVSLPVDLRMEIGDFLTFADFFFDGFVTDYIVQSKIAEAKEQVLEAIEYVKRILYDLEGLL